VTRVTSGGGGEIGVYAFTFAWLDLQGADEIEEIKTKLRLWWSEQCHGYVDVRGHWSSRRRRRWHFPPQA
jgi:hypothetical protein